MAEASRLQQLQLRELSFILPLQAQHLKMKFGFMLTTHHLLQ
jgi:hypothetical protein